MDLARWTLDAVALLGAVLGVLGLGLLVAVGEAAAIGPLLVASAVLCIVAAGALFVRGGFRDVRGRVVDERVVAAVLGLFALLVGALAANPWLWLGFTD